MACLLNIVINIEYHYTLETQRRLIGLSFKKKMQDKVEGQKRNMVLVINPFSLRSHCTLLCFGILELAPGNISPLAAGAALASVGRGTAQWRHPVR